MEQTNYSDAVIVLLAAGSSTRMGQSKLLLDVGGIPLLRHSAQVALNAQTSRVIVVLGSEEEVHRPILAELPVDIVVNHYWKSGMGSSIKTALHYIIREYAEAKAALIMVSDQPELTTHHLQALIRGYSRSQKKIIASSYDNTVGVPAVFGRSFFSNILMLRDEEGAKKIIAQFSEQVTAVPFPAGGVDLDTQADYARFLSQNSNKKD